jgi:hypothetical protein
MTFLVFGITLMLTQADTAPKSNDDLRKAVILYASFDEAAKADIAGGQTTLDTRFGPPGEFEKYVFEKGFNEKVFRIAKDGGISGGALEVVDVLPNNGRVFFPAKGNLPFDPKGWEGSLSVWCKTDPNKLLKTTFCDPIQITEKGANNGGLWIDFNNAKPRDMRHGAFPAVAAGEKPIAEDDPKAPLVQVGKVDWQADAWHHVVLAWSGLDTGKNAVSKIFIDGKLIGEIRDRPLAMQWDLDKTGIYVGVNYIGLLDELTIFRRSLTAEEIVQLHREPGWMK